MSKQKRWAGILVHTPTHILLVPHGTLGWSFPGGKIEPHPVEEGSESPLEAAVRELREETGLEFQHVSTKYARWTTGDLPGWKCCVLQHPLDTCSPVDESTGARWWSKDLLPSEVANSKLWRAAQMAWKTKGPTVINRSPSKLKTRSVS